jgi:hypothetical protein
MSEDIIDVDPMDSAMKNAKVINSADEAGTVKFENGVSQCYWNDAGFPEGTRVCDNGTVYECQVGHWLKLKIGC